MTHSCAMKIGVPLDRYLVLDDRVCIQGVIIWVTLRRLMTKMGCWYYELVILAEASMCILDMCIAAHISFWVYALRFYSLQHSSYSWQRYYYVGVASISARQSIGITATLPLCPL